VIPSAMETLLDNSFIWLVPVLLPIVAAVVVLPVRSRAVSVVLAPWAALPALVLSILPQATRAVDVPWLLLGSRLGLDEIARVLLFFTSVLWLTSGVYAVSYFRKNPERHRFLFFFLLAMSGNFGLILAQDMVLYYVCFALMSFASYGLVVFNADREAVRAGRVYIALVIVGELLLFSGLVAATWTTGSTLWVGLGDRLADATHGNIAVALLFGGLAIKAGVLPLHVWLPLAHPAAPAPASAVLSGAMIKAGLIGWLRLVPLGGFVALTGWADLCLVLGIAAAFYGVAVGITQTNPKTVLAYSSISQMGLITVAFGLAVSADSPRYALAPVLAYAMHHGFAKGALFLGVGVVPAVRDAPWSRWIWSVGLLLPALALAGLPLTSGALAKSMLKSQVASAPNGWPELLGVLLPIAALGTTLLMARFLAVVWSNAQNAAATSPRGVWVSWLLLLGFAVLGVYLWPWGDDIAIGKQMCSATKIWAASWPVICAAAIATSVNLLSTRGYRLRIPCIPAGDILVVVIATAHFVRRQCHSVTKPLLSIAASWQFGMADHFKTIHRVLDRSQLLEALLRRSVVFGIVLLILIGVLIGFLAIPDA